MKYLIGNLKMNLCLKDYRAYLKGIDKVAKKSDNYVGVAVPYPYLHIASKSLKNVNYGAQNCHFESKGAFTGEVSVNMLTDFACKLCIVGHSERRTYNNENDKDINLKIKKLIANNITPILCFGESLQEKEAGKTKSVIKKQITKALEGVEELEKVIFAYEPIWAIGTGLTPTLKDIKTISKYIKDLINKLGAKRENIVLLYGGSVNEKNVREILSLSDVDGGLIGGACLKVESFSQIINCN